MSFQRKQEDNRRLKRLYERTKYGYGAGAYFDSEKQRLVRYSCISEGKYWKRHSNKCVRHKRHLPSGNSYRKVFDYYWQQF